jgi:hypothetical protein
MKTAQKGGAHLQQVLPLEDSGDPMISSNKTELRKQKHTMQQF